jgi:hypothetical protein
MSATSYASERRRNNAAALGAAGWLGLAAAPTFAIMALLTCASYGDAAMLCSASHGVLPLNGMALMYLLMSIFHSAPWLRLRPTSRRGLASPAPSGAARDNSSR